MQVVGAALGGVGEDGVGGDDEAVAVELGGVGEGRRGVGMAVRVIELDELVEGLFGVGRGVGLGEYVVGRWVGCGRPGWWRRGWLAGGGWRRLWFEGVRWISSVLHSGVGARALP